MPIKTTGYPIGKSVLKTVQVALTGTTHATLVAVPNDTQTSYRIIKVFGANGAGDARTLSLVFNNSGTRTTIWQSASTANGALFFGDGGTEVFPLDLVLSSENHKLEMVSSGSGTDTIVCTYEIMET